MKNYENLSFWSVIEPKKRQIHFVDVKETRKRPSSVIDLHSKEGANTAIKVLTRHVTGVLSVSRRYTKGVTGI